MLLKELLNITEKNWVGDVKTGTHPPEGLFADGSAEEIADWAWKSHSSDLQSAMASLNFFVNRNKNISKEIIAKVEKAKEILRKK